tara:strand:+ start:256 stop:522 length:267 start_codon:yes stop_codon:yes gene_type:complete
MASFTWVESALTADCSSLADMAKRFEDTAVLMRRLDKHGFEIRNECGKRTINHRNPRVFSRFGFIIDKLMTQIQANSCESSNNLNEKL